MTAYRIWIAICFVTCLGPVAPAAPTPEKPEAAPTYRVIYYVQNSQYGPSGGPTEASPGLFYFDGGAQVIFSVTSQGSSTTIASFSDPPYIVESKPIAAANGLVYSSFETDNGNGGLYCVSNVFAVGTAPGSQQNYATSDYSPFFFQNLPDGGLLGWGSSCSHGGWNVFKSDLSGNVASLYQWPANGGYPDQPFVVLYGADGNYYGNAEVNSGGGYVYQLTPAGAFKTVYTFPPPGVGYMLLQASDGNFYGSTPPSTPAGTFKANGTIYKLTPSGQYTLLHTFPKGFGGQVNSMIEASDGRFYGASGGGEGQDSLLFRMSKSGEFKVLLRLGNGTSQGICSCAVTQGSDGIIYGYAAGGGPSGFGLVFALDAGLPKPQPKALQFQPSSGSRHPGADLGQQSLRGDG